MLSVIKKLFGSASKQLKIYKDKVQKINSLEDSLLKLTSVELADKTAQFKQRYSNGESLNSMLVEAFAVTREAGRRALNMRHFDVQLIGAMALHDGYIAEMKTGEGKTLVATAACYLNAISGKGVHLVTVNDYLAKHQSQLMSKLHNSLGISVSCIEDGMNAPQRQKAYNADITYGTNHEFGFDYLRDNMKYSKQEMVMLNRGFSYVVVDEVDSILIDEARTPLIISGPSADSSKLYTAIDNIIKKLGKDDCEIDEKNKSVFLTDSGHEKVEEKLRKAGIVGQHSTIYDADCARVLHHVNQALRANLNYKKDVDYIVKNNKVIIIDEFTGRMMEDRRFSDGLHQALEAKEGAKINPENQTLASITYQNYFRLYDKISGMTGTASTESVEFEDIYGLKVLQIPTNKPMIRQDLDDMVFKSEEEKFENIIKLTKECHQKGQPVLIGTISIEKSETLASLLKKEKIEYNILNAKYHEQEAEIIAQAGRKGAVTIATNMAGRGTDIMLGGNLDSKISSVSEKMKGKPEKDLLKEIESVKAEHEQEKKNVESAGGLFVVGSERHESRRIDNQLRGRSGRQGDNGSSQFFLSMKDDLLRIFGGEKIDFILDKLGFKGGEAINHPMLNRVIEKAQRRVEGYNYDVRKNLLRYDDVINEQRKVVYAQRLEIMSQTNIDETFANILDSLITALVNKFAPENSYPEQWKTHELSEELIRIFGNSLSLQNIIQEELASTPQELLEKLLNDTEWVQLEVKKRYNERVFCLLVKRVMLSCLDNVWRDHLYFIDALRRGISLRSYAQKDPLNEYKIESFHMFEEMMNRFADLTAVGVFHSEIDISKETLNKISSMTDEEFSHFSLF